MEGTAPAKTRRQASEVVRRPLFLAHFSKGRDPGKVREVARPRKFWKNKAFLSKRRRGQ